MRTSHVNEHEGRQDYGHGTWRWPWCRGKDNGNYGLHHHVREAQLSPAPLADHVAWRQETQKHLEIKRNKYKEDINFKPT